MPKQFNVIHSVQQRLQHFAVNVYTSFRRPVKKYCLQTQFTGSPLKPVYFTLQHYFIPKLCRCLNTLISINGLEYIAAHLKCVPRVCVCVCVTVYRCVCAMIGCLFVHLISLQPKLDLQKFVSVKTKQKNSFVLKKKVNFPYKQNKFL